MKKITLICILFLLLTGCQKDSKVSLKDYHAFVQAIETQINYKESSKYFDIFLYINKVENSYRYDIIIASPTERLSQVKVVCKDNGEEVYYPSLGVYDSPVTLDDYTDKEALVYKGINLSGMVKFQKIVVKVLVEFTDESGKVHQEYIELIGKGD